MAAPTVSMPLPTVRKESSATITTGYSAVSFVPTEHVQTAVSEMDDHIVIDIIVPPTRYLPPTLTVAQIMKQIQEDLIRELENLGQGLGSSIASVAHPRSMYAEAEQFMRDAAGRLIDPALLPQNRSEFNRARLGIRSLRGESLLTYFPSPAAAEPKLVNQQVTTCPCVCCRSGCTGADPRTKRLPLLTESLAKDANGNTIVDVPPPQSTARVVLGEPFTEATSLRRDAPRPIPAIRSMDNLRDATAIKYNDIKTHANAAPVLTGPSFPSMPTSQYRREWQIPLPSTGSKPSSHLVVRPNSQRHMDSYDQRAQKGMSVFAPLQLSDDLAAALTLHDLGSTDISPELSRYTPPLSSPSSIGSTPRVRGDTSRPQDLSPPDSSIDATATPIAARFSRSLSNLRQKAQRDAEIPPVPQTPATLLHAPKPPTYAAPNSRVRILSGPTQQSYRFH